jgi:hypothetical protein
MPVRTYRTGVPVTIGDCEALLIEARLVLEHYMFDGVDLRDDIAEICRKIDNALPVATDSNRPRVLQGITRVG